jgi:hypothetical protein
MKTAEQRRPEPQIEADDDGPLACTECGDPLLAIERVLGAGRCRSCRRPESDTKEEMPDGRGGKEIHLK